ncbi:MAG: rubrerythrin family protein [Methanophagales archaeon ANME-1-THS]|nr:MAG: rubrerythrin family protein [Methanophagales archaeon ANME-1-THS]
MVTTPLGDKLKKQILRFQKNEITEHCIYHKLAQSVKDEQNKKVLLDISNEELRHYHVWKTYTNQDVKPSRVMLWKYYLIARILGITFGIKLMEKGEENAQVSYGATASLVPDARNIERDENEHENALIHMINEERLMYVGSIVLGLNDALVELTGALAGFTFAFQNTHLIALAGLITGIAASLSMGASEYLSTKSEAGEEGLKSPVKASVYTSLAYILTVLFLILPFFILPNVYLALGATLVNALIVILLFTFYISVAKDLPFRKRFLEMATISICVAALTFAIGFLIRLFLGIEI